MRRRARKSILKREIICAISDRLRRSYPFSKLSHEELEHEAKLFYSSMRKRGWAIVPSRPRWWQVPKDAPAGGGE